VLKDLTRNAALSRNGGNGYVGGVLSPANSENLIQAVKLWKKERTGLLLLRKLIL
jgi:predicted metal-binding protein